MSRKTIPVKEVLLNANEMLKSSTSSPDLRRGIMILVETILHNTDMYAGYRYLSTNEVPAGQLPGIVTGEDGTHTFPDATRVSYYSHYLLG